MTTIALLGTLDTKGEACAFVRERLVELGCEVLTIDVGVLGDPLFAADVMRGRVAEAAGADLAALAVEHDRGAAVEAMGRGAAVIVRDLLEGGAIGAVLSLGGSAGASIAATAFAELPLGFPKVLVSTVVAGDTRPYIVRDVTLLHPVVDLAGVNPVSARVLANAAAAVAGMARVARASATLPQKGPLVALTMFGITTPCVDAVRQLLTEQDFVPLVFSANGAGGDEMEEMVSRGAIAGVADLTTTELADRLVGGQLPAGEHRLEAAGARGLPQVVSAGALDVVNFGPWDTVPPGFRDRRLYRHNPRVTLMRTSREECAELGRILAEKLNRGHGPRTVVVPLGGVSALSGPGEPFHDPEADRALFDALRNELDDDVELVEIDAHINDPSFAGTVADRFTAAYRRFQEESTTR